MSRRVVMAGSAFDVRGGVSAMARVCERQGLFDRGAAYLDTHCDGSAWRKATRAAGAFARFAAMLARGQVALLHVHLNSGASFWRKSLFVAAARRAGVPYVLHVHCGNFSRFVNERAGARGAALARRLLREAAAVIALSPQGRAELEAIAPGLAVQVIPNPVELPAEAHQARRRDNTLRNATVLFLGAITEAKGAFDLLQAWARVAPLHPEARLVLAGTGEVDRARARAEALGIVSQVEFPGWVDGEAKASLLDSAMVFALPSHAEAVPMSVLEAMAWGVPVIASGVGGVPWMLDEGRAGRLVTPKDVGELAGALDELLSHPAECRRLGAAGRERAALEFAAGVVVPRIEALWCRHAELNRTPGRVTAGSHAALSRGHERAR